LGIALGKPVYVTGVNAAENRVTLGPSEELFSDSVYLRDINLLAADRFETPVRCMAKVRYNQSEQPCTAVQTTEEEIHLLFDEPQKSVTPGQSCVLYDGDTVLMGGIAKG
jgi:tRNA-specific 2-thiouridylase